MLVGDTPLDVEAALAAGARAVAVATGSYPAADLTAAGAHVVLPDLTDTGGVVAAVTGSPRRGEKAPLDSGGHRRGAAGHAPACANARSRYVLTVASLTNRAWPISALVSPRDTRASTSVSRAVSASGRRPAHWQMSRSATTGASTVSPRAAPLWPGAGRPAACP